MKKQVNKQAKKASKLAKAENLKKKQTQSPFDRGIDNSLSRGMKSTTITVKNAEGDPDTTAEIIIQNQINYTPKVSVIIPVYNVEEYLRECLDSVVNQTLKEIEIICVDDGSTDSSLKILKEYAARDNRITILAQQNLHAGVARNAGLSQAKGEYLSFLDSDDVFNVHMLERMHKKAQNDNAEVVICNALKNVNGELQEGIFIKEKHLKRNIFSCSEKDAALSVFQAIYGFPWNKLIAHSIVNRHNLRFSSIDHHNDTSFVMTTIVAAYKISYTTEKYIYYRYRENSICHASKDVSCMYKSLKETYQNISKLDNFKYVKRSFLNYALEFVIYYYRKKSNVEKIELLPYIAKLYEQFEFKNYPISFFDNIPQYRELKHIVDYKNKRDLSIKDIYIQNSINFEPKVSVVIPVYNVEDYLRECLDSVVNQTLKDIEIICINDGSPDNSLQILEQYAASDSRITIVSQKNKGLGASRNVGSSLANAPYVFFLDSDDFIALEALENLYNKIEQTQAELCQYLAYRYDNITKEINLLPNAVFDAVRQKKEVYNYKANPKLMFEQVEAWRKLYKKDFLIRNGISFFENSYFEDTLTHIKCFALAKKVCLVDQGYIYYRYNREGQITGKSENTDKFLDIFNYINGAEEFLKNKHCWGDVKKYYYTFAVRRICSYFGRCNDDTKVKFAKKVIEWCKDKDLAELINSAPEKFEPFYLIVKKDSLKDKIYSYFLFPYYLISNHFLKKEKGRLQGYTVKVLRSLPNIKADYFIPIGERCRVSHQLKEHNLRNVSLPFDYLAGFSLDLILDTIKSGINLWFEEGFEDKIKSTKKERCIYDIKNKFRSKHIFPADRTVEEYMPEFKETFARRTRRLRNILKTSNHICFVCNNRHKPIADFAVPGKIQANKRNTITDFIDFLKKLKTMYPNKKWTLLHVEHSDSEREIRQYKAGEDITVYNIKTFDINEKGDGKSNDDAWKGNTKTWNEICSHLSLNNNNPKSTKKTSGFKHFLYHKVKTDSYTKTYICGIRVKKKPANIYEFIDKRLATLSKKWEDKFATVVKTGSKNKKDLLARISTLEKEIDLIKSNSLYMIKSLNNKTAEVLGAQSVLAEMLQNTQAEGIAEILDYMTHLPERMAENSTKNKEEITEKIINIEDRLRSCRTEIIERVDNIKAK